MDTRTGWTERDENMADEITEDEIRRAIWKLRSGGVCGIQGELLKAGGEIIVKWLQKSCNLVWRTGLAPVDWRRAVIVPIHKKCSKKVCKN